MNSSPKISMRGHATTQLKATNVKVLFGYQTIEHEGDDSDQQQQFNDDNSNTIYNNNNDNSATLATSVLTKQISRLFKDSSEDKSHVLALPQPSTVASTYTGLFQLIETATAKANFISTTLSHSPSIHDTRSTNVIASPTTIPDMKTAKSNAIRLDIFSHNVTQHPASFIPSITHTGSNRTLELDDYHVLLDEMRTSFMAVYDFEDPLEISPCSSYEREPLMSKESCKSDVTQWIISQLIESFIKIKPKSPEAIAEIVLIGPVLDEKTYRTLFNCFISEVKNTSSLDLLKGLVQLVECASNGYLVGDDLSRAIIALSERMSSPLTCTNKYHSYLVWALSHILDMTVSGKVRDLNRDHDHQFTIQSLADLDNCDDIYLRYQAAYARQALQCVFDDVSPYQEVWKHVQETICVSLADAGILMTDAEELLDSVAGFPRAGDIEQNVFVVSGEKSKDTAEHIETFHEGSESTRITENKYDIPKKCSWYLTLQVTTLLIRQGRFSDFNKIVSHAPCWNDPNFQFGICRQLGEIAVDPLVDILIRQQAIKFLDEMYNVFSNLQPREDIKRWIFTILLQISLLSEESVKKDAVCLLNELKIYGTSKPIDTYPWKNLLRPTSYPLSTAFQKILKIEYDLHKIRWRRMTEYEQSVYIPQMAKPSLHASNDEASSLMDNARSFLASNRQVMLILGDSGTGKSTFIRHLEKILWQEYTPGNRIPLFINLPAMRNSGNLFREQLMEYNFLEDQIQKLLEYPRFILICDSYDEARLSCNIYADNFRNLSGQHNSKLIITCRSQYLGSEYLYKFAPKPKDHYDPIAKHLFQECVITPFNKDQIKDYVEQYIPFEPSKWSKSDYMDKLNAIPSLMDLIQNPFLLKLCLDALPTVIKSETDLSRLRVTRTQLYDGFVQRWLEVNKRRLQDNMDNDVQEFLDDGFIQSWFTYQMELAMAIFHKEDGHPIVEYTSQHKNSWKGEFFGSNRRKSLLLESSLLKRAGIRYQFIHQSLLEYFYSCTIYDPTGKDTYGIQSYTPIGDHPLSKCNLVKESSIIQFLSERVYKDPNFKYHLLAIIEQSKVDEHAAQAATNAITILVKAGVRFNGRDLRGIRIPGADLRGGEFDSVQFQGADLRKANFTKSWIRQTDFTNAFMEGVYFGELQYLKFKKKVCSCAYSPDGLTFAVGLHCNDIIVYNTIDWTQIIVIKGHKKTVNSLAFSPSSSQLISGSDDNIVGLWSHVNGSNIIPLEEHVSKVIYVAFLPCGKQAISASDDGVVIMWNTQKCFMESKFSGGNIPLAISLSPNGKNFSSAYLDGKIRVFNIQATEISETDISLTECKSSLIKSIAYSPDGSKIVLGHENGRLRLWEFNTSNLIHWKGHDEAINMVAFSPNGHWIASCSKDKTIKLWDAHKGEFAFSLAGHVRSTSAIVFSPNSLVLATGSSDKTVRLWDLTANRTEYIKNRKSEAENSIFSIDGRHVITANRSGIVRQFNTLTGELEKSITFGNTKSKLVVISPDGLLIATTEKSNRSVYMWSTESGQKKFGPFKHPEIVKAVAFSPQDFMVAISSNKLIYLWNIKSGNLFGVCGLGDRLGCATSLQFSSNGQQLVISGNNALIFVLEINTGIIKEIPAKECTDDVIAAVGFSPRSLRITASNISKCNFSIWNQLDSTFQNTLKCKVPIYKFAWSYCEQWIATGSGTSVSLWNMPPDRLKEWTCATIIRDFHREIRSIDWKRNSLEFVTGCEDGSVRVWRLVETLNIWTVQLVWSAGNEVFVASRVSFSGAVDLSTTNRRLLEQRSESKDVSFFRI